MRHKQNTQNLSRFSSYYKATIISLARAVLINQKIVTTKLKAKISRRLVEKLITLGKQIDSLAARRRAFSILSDHALVKKLFTDIAPVFAGKTGGYTRIIPYKRRRGDNAEMVVLELSLKKEPKAPAVAEKASKDDERVKKASEAAIRTAKGRVAHSAPPAKAKRKKDSKKPSTKKSGGLGKLFKQERDSIG
ncbi:MAG: 50S ribosomal protein L17 [Candidatus Omnitrophota bacterium]